MSAVSSYIAYARALSRLGWTPAEFMVAESFAARLRGMLGRQPVATACHSSWHSRNALRSTLALWPIPSTLPSSITMAIFSHATNTSALGACVHTQAPGQYWNAPQSSHRLPPFNECRLECPERKTSCCRLMLLTCRSIGSRSWPMSRSKLF